MIMAIRDKTYYCLPKEEKTTNFMKISREDHQN